MVSRICMRFFSTKKEATKRYIVRQTTDEFSNRAREHNFRARSAFKLMEIDDKFKFLKEGKVVLDVGCAPGSWLQVVAQRCNLKNPGTQGYAIGVDLQNVLPIQGVDILSLSDITDKNVQFKIEKKLKCRPVDVVLSDMAPNPTGDNATDHLRLIELCRKVFGLFASEEDRILNLSKNGVFLCKIWDGQHRSEFVTELQKKFGFVKTLKPMACRDNKMPWRTAVKVALAAGEALAKAVTRAVRDEIRQTQHAAQRHATATGQTQSEAKENANANAKLGISLEVYRAKERIDEELARLEQKNEESAENSK
ncbi:unnamed protein product [Caenorhabditis bovis]|uniref:rRNA methyltransferase 2, mitochondrial n=1 Tax=Caenorhabditis bovis TaxID=2654633 RepID=A0A8S1ECI6_9PELO|nr:unnamed protein product [Caenorhabditis bovis]